MRVSWKRYIFIGLSIFLLLQLVFWGLIGMTLQRLSATSSVAEAERQIRRLDALADWYPLISMGTYRLPGVIELWEVSGSVADAGKQALLLIALVEPAMEDSLSGSAVAQADIRQLFLEMTSLANQLEKIADQLARPGWIVAMMPERETRIAQLEMIVTKIKEVESMEQAWLELMGYESEKHYVVLLQNNMELWPTGGYLGSYASFYMRQGGLQDLVIEAIGVPNGQIQGYVDAPDPIERYTHQGGKPGWRLRESNWNPDFPAAAETIEWFFTEGNVAENDGMVAINLIPVMELVGVIGSLHLPDYNVTLTEENFYETTQRHTSYAFFDGSTQKRDFLGHAGRQLLFTLMDDPGKYAPAVARVLLRNLEQRQILVVVDQQEVAAWMQRRGWDGSIPTVECQTNGDCEADFLHVNEANLGINKTNCCLERRYSDVVRVTDTRIEHRLQLGVKNNNPGIPEPPLYWGGGYQAWVRLYVPANASDVVVSWNDTEVEYPDVEITTYEDKSVIGFLMIVPGSHERTYTVTYSLPRTGSEAAIYEYRLLKQPGVNSIPWSVSVNDEIEQVVELTSDAWISARLR